MSSEHRLCRTAVFSKTHLSLIIIRTVNIILVALRLRSPRFHSPRLCRVAVFLIQTNVSLSSSRTGNALSERGSRVTAAERPKWGLFKRKTEVFKSSLSRADTVTEDSDPRDSDDLLS